jgi:hypothetical protein
MYILVMQRPGVIACLSNKNAHYRKNIDIHVIIYYQKNIDSLVRWKSSIIFGSKYNLVLNIGIIPSEIDLVTSGKRGFYPPPLVPKLYGPGLKGALVPVRAAGARPAPSPGS